MASSSARRRFDDEGQDHQAQISNGSHKHSRVNLHAQSDGDDYKGNTGNDFNGTRDSIDNGRSLSVTDDLYGNNKQFSRGSLRFIIVSGSTSMGIYTKHSGHSHPRWKPRTYLGGNYFIRMAM